MSCVDFVMSRAINDRRLIRSGTAKIAENGARGSLEYDRVVLSFLAYPIQNVAKKYRYIHKRIAEIFIRQIYSIRKINALITKLIRMYD